MLAAVSLADLIEGVFSRGGAFALGREAVGKRLPL